MDIMTETLPITIQASDELIADIKNIEAICNKLEAQLNFHTMTANWYGDEANIVQINFYLISLKEHTRVDTHVDHVEGEILADDVRLLSSTNALLDCYVAMTEAESLMLLQQPKLLSGYLAKKLTKVLNLIAERQKLPPI
jgi:hypothetical protein